MATKWPNRACWSRSARSSSSLGSATPSYHNGTTTPCLSLSVPVPLDVLNADKSAVLSPRVPPCRPLSLSGSDYEQRRSQVRVLPSAPLFTLQMESFLAKSFRPLPSYLSNGLLRHSQKLAQVDVRILQLGRVDRTLGFDQPHRAAQVPSPVESHGCQYPPIL